MQISPSQINPDNISLPEENLTKAAITIQKNVRKYLASKAFLPSSQRQLYRSLCDRVITNPACMPEVPLGLSKVYLPEDAPNIVIKETKDLSPAARFYNMLDLRRELTKQQSKCIFIPKCTLCNGFLIEERMNIDFDYFCNLQMYIENIELFTPLVKELVKLFQEYYLSDLIFRSSSRWNNLSGVKSSVRYDNFPLMIKSDSKGNKRGAVALIDLEHMKKVDCLATNIPLEKRNEDKLQNIEQNSIKFSELVRIFPFHKDVIEEELNSLNIPYNKELLNEEEEAGKTYINNVYHSYLSYCSRRGIKNDITTWEWKSILATDSKIKKLTEKLLQLNENILDKSRGLDATVDFSGYLKGKNETELKASAAALSHIILTKALQNLNSVIANHISNVISSNRNNSEIKNGQMISLRDIYSPRTKLNDEIEELILKSDCVIDIISLSADFSFRVFFEQIFTLILDDMVTNGEIFNHDTGHKSGNNYLSIRI